MNLLSSHSLKKETVFIIDFGGISRVKGSVVQLVRMLPCHGRGRGFESRPVRLNLVKTRSGSGFCILRSIFWSIKTCFYEKLYLFLPYFI